MWERLPADDRKCRFQGHGQKDKHRRRKSYEILTDFMISSKPLGKSFINNHAKNQSLLISLSIQVQSINKKSLIVHLMSLYGCKYLVSMEIAEAHLKINILYFLLVEV
jgi:hypothetical protein